MLLKFRGLVAFIIIPHLHTICPSLLLLRIQWPRKYTVNDEQVIIFVLIIKFTEQKQL